MTGDAPCAAKNGGEQRQLDKVREPERRLDRQRDSCESAGWRQAGAQGEPKESRTHSSVEMDHDAYGLRATGLTNGVNVRGLGGDVTSDGDDDNGACMTRRTRAGGRWGRKQAAIARSLLTSSDRSHPRPYNTTTTIT